MGNKEITLNHLKQLVLNEDQIAEMNIDYIELIEVRLSESVFAPIWMSHLKTHLKHFPAESEGLQIRIYQSSEQWCALYQHQYFQRRQKAGSNVESDKTQEYHLVKDGQVIGPFNAQEIQIKLDRIELLKTDIISLDGGVNWLHLYDLSIFDRRQGKMIAPPPPPDDQIMIPTHEDIQKRIDHLGKNFTETEAVAGLAYFGNLQTGKASGDENWEKIKKSERNNKSVKEKTSTNIRLELSKLKAQNKKYTYLFAFSLIGLCFLYLTWDWGKKPAMAGKDPNKSSRQGTQVKPVAPAKAPNRAPAAVSTPSFKKKSVSAPTKNTSPFKKSTSSSRPTAVKKSTTTTPTPFKRSGRRTIARPTKSFTKSKSFEKVETRDRELSDNPLEEKDPYYDDGTVTDEQDPVRRQASKENLDPYENEVEENYDEAERELPPLEQDNY